jgi:hypothetical protein
MNEQERWDWPEKPELCHGCYVSSPNETETICQIQPTWDGKK